MGGAPNMVTYMVARNRNSKSHTPQNSNFVGVVLSEGVVVCVRWTISEQQGAVCEWCDRRGGVVG